MLSRADAPRTVTVYERGTTDIELSDQQAAALQALRFCSVTPSGQPGIWRIGDVNQIGVAALPGLRVHIKPKTSLENILFLASYAQDQVDLGLSYSYDSGAGLPTAVAAAFIEAVEQCTLGGLIKGYRTVHQTGNVVRGRWDIPRQMKRRPGVPLPLELTVDEFTPDVPENQVLITAVERLVRTPELSDALRRRMHRLRVSFDEVLPLRNGPVPEIPQTRLNQHYSYALMLARLIIDSTTWSHRPGQQAGRSFLIRMPALFERFVHRVFSRLMSPEGLTVGEQDRSYVLDRGGRVPLRPDLVIRSGTEVVGIADLKYKVWDAQGGSPPNADVYQALAYALAAGLDRAHLLYVSGDVTPAEFEIASAQKTVVAHTVDLSGTPQAIIDSVHRVGREILADALVAV